MKKASFIFISALLACLPSAGQAQSSEQTASKQTTQCVRTDCPLSACGAGICAVAHPWQGKRVAFLGDSMTDPKNNSNDVPDKYWNYLSQWLGITPYVYGISGRQWDDVPRQVETLKAEHGDDVDAITVFIGTNDFNAGVPLGRWYDEREDTVLAAVHGQRREYVRKHRTPAMDKETFRGRINIAIERMKTLYPDKQIVLLTPIHRGRAEFNATNIQPDENWQNICGEYFSEYVDAVKEAGNVWGIPVIDLNAVSGMNPMVEAQQPYFRDSATDLLHPSDKGQRRLAMTLVRQLAALPVF